MSWLCPFRGVLREKHSCWRVQVREKVYVWWKDAKESTVFHFYWHRETCVGCLTVEILGSFAWESIYPCRQQKLSQLAETCNITWWSNAESCLLQKGLEVTTNVWSPHKSLAQTNTSCLILHLILYHVWLLVVQGQQNPIRACCNLIPNPMTILLHFGWSQLSRYYHI